MWLRRGFLRWMLPAAAALPLWLFVGWAVFSAGAWSFLGVFFVLAPSVLIGQLVLTLLVRLRPSVRVEGALSWRDVAGMSAWQAAVVASGCFAPHAFGVLLLVTVLVFVAAFWSSAAQLVREWRVPAPPAWSDETRAREAADGVYVIHESPRMPRP